MSRTLGRRVAARVFAVAAQCLAGPARWLAVLVLAAPILTAGPGSTPAAESRPGRAAGGDEPETPALGFTARSFEDERALENLFASRLDPGRISATHRTLTAKPHRAGTEGARRVALYLAEEAKKAGFKPETASYLSWLTEPGPASALLVAPVAKTLSLVEDRVPGDPFTDAAATQPGFCAYSGSGSAEGEVVFAGQGTWEDIKSLDESGVSLQGRVALMRYFGAGEGTKVLRAQNHGAVAALLYADPADDGFTQGPVYPKGDWRPPGSIMRRSLDDLPYEGDPLTPGRASKPGAKALDPKEVKGLPSIPVLPISYRDAALIVSRLDGPVVPDRMRGGLVEGGSVPAGHDAPGGGGAPAGKGSTPASGGPERLEYRFGPGPARIRMSVRMEGRRGTIRDVIVTIPGREEPDTWVIVSNHHDAWIYGAGDPSSGTAALLEEIRALGDLHQTGWRPRRTLVLAFWDAEEMNLGGSAEWAEDHAEELRRKGAAVVNMDSAVFNADRPLYVDASPCLHRLIREVAASIPGPRAGESLAETWLRMQIETRGLHSTDGPSVDEDPSRPPRRPQIDPVSLGDDQTSFVEYLALPGMDMFYGADYGVYHSLYENRHWMETVVDPAFRYHRLMADLQGRLALRLAMAPVLPLDPEETAAAWETALHVLGDRASEVNVSARVLNPVRRALRRFREAAAAFAASRDAALAAGSWTSADAPDVLVAVNREVAAIDRSFFAAEGLPAHPWWRGLWVAPSRDIPFLDDPRLPGLRWPLEMRQAPTLAREVQVYSLALDEATAHLHRAAGLLQGLAAGTTTR